MTNPIKTIHCVGIAGIGVSALAQLLAHDGHHVSGSDTIVPAVATQLAQAHITVYDTYNETNVPKEVDIVIHTLAADDANPELIEARRRGIPIWPYAQGLAWWARDRRMIAVAGTHGKSTTTALLGTILIEAGLDPTVLVGSQVPAFGGNVRFGSSDLFVVEADEYGRAFLNYSPFAAVITNVDWDHVDTYPTVEAFQEAFKAFVQKLPKDGTLVFNAEDAASQVLSTSTQADAKSFGLTKGDISAESFGLTLRIPGQHNQANAMAAASMARSLGVNDASIRKALEGFTGLWRRQEIVGQYRQATVISDYGHHPREITATLEAVRSAYPQQRMIVLFQPHRKKRLQQFFHDFQLVLSSLHPLIVVDVYEPPGEDDAVMVSARDLIQGRTESDVVYAATWDEAHQSLNALIKPRDILVVFTAGDLDSEVRKLVSPL